MKILLVLISLGAGAFAYYEFHLVQQHSADYEKQMSDLNSRYAVLSQQKQALVEENGRLTRNLTSLQQQAASAQGQPTPAPQ
jgi:uncharacterized protein HemX